MTDDQWLFDDVGDNDAAVRDPITFTVRVRSHITGKTAEHHFTARGEIPAGWLFDLRDEVPLAELSEFLLRVLNSDDAERDSNGQVKVASSAERFHTLIRDPEYIIKAETIGRVAQRLLDHYTDDGSGARPMPLPASSSPRRGRTGRTTTGRRSSPGSTSGRSLRAAP